MFEAKGRADGARDAAADALANMRRRPRPQVSLALISKGYLSEYLDAYRRGYAEHRHAVERRQAESNVREAHATPAKAPKPVQDFDHGWRDAYEGRDAKAGRGDPETYASGYRLGARDLDQVRALELLNERRHRQKLQHAHEQNSRER